ncbi:von Willebrand factor type A domain-containing protein [Litoreibacter ascidiaceicola]|uniref:von Willebrand factor type A domain-containing protein n=1 Tax=Litoreibacter ascidiaceicola TaxID=1486859 RepID=A0A1M4TZ46_9RHOB|nr:vWA domain-containing protein [Litoreibacter ascidiaceicola]SHE49614.1 von Willebrand factor type A domain-containing protein [Litoreibacter ascidiaceicola]
MTKIFSAPRAALLAATFLAACAGGIEEEVVIVEPVLAEPSVSAEAAPSAKVSTTIAPRPLPVPVPSHQGAARRGVITAGDIDDALNLAAFSRYQAKSRKELKLPMANLATPVLAQLRGADGKAAPGVRVTLRKPGAAEPFYSGYSGVDGMISIFPASLGAGRLREVELRAIPDGQGAPMVQRLRTGQRAQVQLPFNGKWSPEFLDLAFVVDTTGSMADELAWLTKELKGLVRQAKRAAPGVDIRYGLVVYRDDGDAYVVKNYGFTKKQSQMQGWLRAQSAGGGGDYPEAAARALASAAGMQWRNGKGERLMIHVADAPEHDHRAKAYLQAARTAAAKGVQVFGLGASGVGPEAEYLMRQAAVQTGGRYMFLTDDSGVGYGHMEPTVSCYRVTALSDLVSRVLRSELSGRRIEAAPSKVVRTVGSYRNGVCVN